MTKNTDALLDAYSAALDEVYRLRTVLALQAMGQAADLSMKTFPKSRRGWAEKRITECQDAACGQSSRVLAGKDSNVLRAARTHAGVPQTLTREQWEASLTGGAA
jgi:hypothetical protein